MKIIILIITMLICTIPSDAQNYPQWKFMHKENTINLTEFFDGQQQHSVNNTDSCLYKIDNQHFYFDSKYQASFNGGNDSLYAFIRRELNISIYYNIIPKVYVAFIVDNVGLIKYCGIYRGFDQECDKAVLTLLSKMPNWHPAICDNKTVSSFNILKIDFSIIH